MAVNNYDSDTGYYNKRSFGSRVWWGAIIAGVVVVLMTQALLNLLGLAIGFQVMDPANPNYTGLGIGSAVWMIVSALIAMFLGGWTASTLSNINFKLDGVMHGVITWGLAMLVTFWLLGSGIGNVLGGVFSLANSAVRGTAPAVAEEATQGGGIAAVQQQFGQLTQQAQQQSPQQQGQSQVRGEEVADTAAAVGWTAFAAALLSLIAGGLGGLVGFKKQPNRTSAY